MRAIDYRRVNIAITPGDGITRDILNVGRAEACRADQGGWHYDVDPAQARPRVIRLCPATCQALRGDAKARADLVFGCATRTID